MFGSALAAFVMLGGAGCEKPSTPGPAAQPPPAVRPADTGQERCWKLFRHLVPEDPSASFFSIKSRQGTQYVTNVELKKPETDARLAECFGDPDKVQTAQVKKFWYRSILGFPEAREPTGDLWTYGPVTVMIQDHQVRFVWVEGREYWDLIRKLYEAR